MRGEKDQELECVRYIISGGPSAKGVLQLVSKKEGS